MGELFIFTKIDFLKEAEAPVLVVLILRDKTKETGKY